MSIEEPPLPHSRVGTQRLDSLQAGRFLAALGVVLYHLDLIARAAPWYGAPTVQIFHALSSGVEFFFVLSGFLMAWLYGHRLGETGLPRRFVLSRFRRIYPIYWFVTAALLPIFFWMPTVGEGYERDGLEILTSLLLVPWKHPPIVGVAWTLVFEVWFYVLFTAILWRPSLALPTILLYIVAIVFIKAPDNSFLLQFVLNKFILLFFFGAMAGFLTRSAFARRFNIDIFFAIAATAIVMLAALLWLRAYGMVPRELERNGLGILASVLLFALVRIETTHPFRTPRVLVYLGDTSYALYLVHYPILSVAGKSLASFGIASRFPTISFSLMVLAAIVAGTVVHELIEKRLLRLKFTVAPRPSAS